MSAEATDNSSNNKGGSPTGSTLQSADPPKFREEGVIPDGFLIQLILSLFFIVAGIFIAAKYFRTHISKYFSRLGISSNDNPNIKCIKITPKTRLFLLRLDGRTLAITESTANVSVVDVTPQSSDQSLDQSDISP